MKIFFTKQNIFSFLTILTLLANVAIAGISNNSAVSNFIKIVSSALLLLIFFIHSRLSVIPFYTPAASRSLRKMVRVITIIILYLAITLIYSTNPAYGARKIFNIIISDIPNIIVLFYLITNRQKELYAKHLIYIITAGFIITLSAVLIFQPFNHSTIYQFEPKRWSHVFIGRMISFLTLIVFIYLLNQKESKKTIIYAIIFTIGLYITYLTGLRSALMGLAICTLLSTTWNIYKKRLLNTHIYSFILILIIISLLVYITPQGFSTSQRLSSLVKIEDLDFGNDAAILTRVESYKISWQMFTESPLIGYGFGGFNGYNNIKWTTIQKYPHNIILEILSEMGIVGLLIFGIFFYQIVRSIYNLEFIIYNSKSNHQSSFEKPASPIEAGSIPYRGRQHPASSITTHFLLLAFFFSLFMAMFSKDISTQGFLWLFLAVFSDQRIGDRE